MLSCLDLDHRRGQRFEYRLIDEMIVKVEDRMDDVTVEVGKCDGILRNTETLVGRRVSPREPQIVRERLAAGLHRLSYRCIIR